MSLGYTAHSIYDSSHKRIGETQKNKNKNKKIINKKKTKRDFKFQAENYTYLPKLIYVSIYVFVFG